MVALTQAQINKIFQDFVNEIIRAAPNTAVTLTKSDIKTAITATNTWIDNNAASYNSALAANVQSSLTSAQKSVLFAYVALKKYSG